MAKKGLKRVDGETKTRTIVKLLPVKYQVELHYLGDGRIKHKANEYRCRYALTEASSLDAIDPCTLFPNLVRDVHKADNMDKAARPRDQGGTPVDVDEASDKRYRIVVTDNHGTRTAENLTLLGADGDNNSNPKYYGDRGWMQDVKPAVPFRAVVKKYVGDQQVDLDSDKVKVVFEVKDPPEELDQNDGRRKTFLEDFFKKNNREKKDPTPGDDNAQKEFKGLRVKDHGEAGVKATDVLKKIDYKAPPVVSEKATDKDVVDFGALKPATADGSMNAQFDIKLVAEKTSKLKVGVADLAFVPWPAGGDNYRFLITLKEGGKDVRDTELNGAPVELLDDQKKGIAKPRWYVTPRLTFWRKIEFKTLVLANNVAAGDIDWDKVTKMYRKMFTEVVKPEKEFSLTRNKWKQLLKDVFGNKPEFADNANFTAAKYAARLFPDWITSGVDPDDLFGKIDTFARKAIGLACTQNGIPDPSKSPRREDQNDGNGMAMFLCHDPWATTVLGAYIGDRVFWMQKPTGGDAAKKATSTCAHEFGHVRSLRHSHTKTGSIQYSKGGGSYTMYVANPKFNNRPLDHDAKDAFACLMSYTRSLDAEPCGICALSMRFYDRVEIQKDTATGFKKEIVDRMGPVEIFQLKFDGGTAYLEKVTGTEITLNSATNESVDLFAVGPEIAFTTRSGSNRKGRVNMTLMNKGESWSFTGPGGANQTMIDSGSKKIYTRQRLKAQSAGNVVVKFTMKDISAQVTLKIT